MAPFLQHDCGAAIDSNCFLKAAYRDGDRPGVMYFMMSIANKALRLCIFLAKKSNGLHYLMTQESSCRNSKISTAVSFQAVLVEFTG